MFDFIYHFLQKFLVMRSALYLVFSFDEGSHDFKHELVIEGLFLKVNLVDF